MEVFEHINTVNIFKDLSIVSRISFKEPSVVSSTFVRSPVVGVDPFQEVCDITAFSKVCPPTIERCGCPKRAGSR